MVQRFSEGAIRDKCIERAVGHDSPGDRRQGPELSRRRGRKQDNRCEAVDEPHDRHGGIVVEHLFLCQGIRRPGDRPQQDEQSSLPQLCSAISERRQLITKEHD